MQRGGPIWCRVRPRRGTPVKPGWYVTAGTVARRARRSAAAALALALGAVRGAAGEQPLSALQMARA